MLFYALVENARNVNLFHYMLCAHRDSLATFPLFRDSPKGDETKPEFEELDCHIVETWLSFSLLGFPLIYANHTEIDSSADSEWILFKHFHNKIYETAAEENKRKLIFMKNKQLINDHNEKFTMKKVNYKLELNQFSDLTNDEVYDLLSCNIHRPTLSDNYPTYIDPFSYFWETEWPKNLNWVKKGAVTPVLDQKFCRSCYSFAAISAAEGRYYSRYKRKIALSTQQAIDCSITHGNRGCKGGSISNVFRYFLHHSGLSQSMNYPSTDEANTCKYKENITDVHISDYKAIPRNDEIKLQEALLGGPVAATINAKPFTFYHYKGGLYSDPACDAETLNHAVTIVGYGLDEKTNEKYWLIKNSWGRKWGMKGYMKLKKGVNMCGIAKHAYYPIMQ